MSSKLGFCPLPDTQRVNINDDDYLSNQLLYRDVRNYAIGHGCAANWEETADKVLKIETSISHMYRLSLLFLPAIESVTLEMLKYGPSVILKEHSGTPADVR